MPGRRGGDDSSGDNRDGGGGSGGGRREAAAADRRGHRKVCLCFAFVVWPVLSSPDCATCLLYERLFWVSCGCWCCGMCYAVFVRPFCSDCACLAACLTRVLSALTVGVLLSRRDAVDARNRDEMKAVMAVLFKGRRSPFPARPASMRLRTTRSSSIVLSDSSPPCLPCSLSAAFPAISNLWPSRHSPPPPIASAVSSCSSLAGSVLCRSGEVPARAGRDRRENGPLLSFGNGLHFVFSSLLPGMLCAPCLAFRVLRSSARYLPTVNCQVLRVASLPCASRARLVAAPGIRPSAPSSSSVNQRLCGFASCLCSLCRPRRW